MDLLRRYVLDAAAVHEVDSLESLSKLRSYLFVGAKDPALEAMRLNAKFFESFAAESEKQVLFHDHVPVGHVVPTLAHNGSGIQESGYDGPGHCLRHIYENLTEPVSANPSGWRTLDQHLLGPWNVTGALAKGWMYLPTRCEQGHRCKLHVFLHGCSSVATKMEHAGFNSWAEANDIVILYPQMDPSVAVGCWDAYGWSGSNYATKKGIHMAGVMRLIRYVAGQTVE